MKKFVVMADFSSGMIEAKPDTNYESGFRMPTVQYLENMNPNILLSALVHREGVSVAQLSDSAFAEKDGDIYTACNSYVDLIKKNYMPAGSNPDEYLLCSIPVQVVIPKDSRAWFICLKTNNVVDGVSVPSTRIIGYYCILDYDANDLVTGESWGWIEPFVDSLANPGMKMLVPMSDYAIRGQNILLVGVPDASTYDSLKKYIAPIYVWGFENYRKNKSVLPMDTTGWDERDRQKWKILSPGQLSLDDVRLAQLLQGCVGSTDMTQWEGWKLGSAPVPGVVANWAYTENQKLEKLASKIEVVMWQSRKHPKHIDIRHDKDLLNEFHPYFDPGGNGHINFDIYDYLYQIEDMEIGNDSMSTWFGYGAWGDTTITAENTYYGKGIKAKTTFGFEEGKAPKYLRYGFGDSNSPSIGPSRLIPTGTPFKSLNLNDNRVIDWIKALFDNADEDHAPHCFMLALNTLPNYTKMGIPRTWCKGERIPFVLTLEVNGIETIILEDSYYVLGGAQFVHPNPVVGTFRLGYDGFPTTPGNLFTSTPLSDGEIYNGDELNMYASNSFRFAHSVRLARPVEDDCTEDVELAEALGVYSYRGSWIQGFNIQLMCACNPFVYFTLRFNSDNQHDFYRSLPAGATQFNLYVSLPDDSLPIITDRLGVKSMYGSNLAKKTKGNVEYALVKSFPLIKPVDEVVPTPDAYFRAFKGGDQGDVAVSEGKWLWLNDAGGDRHQAVGEPQLAHVGGAGWYFVPLAYNDTRFKHSDQWTNPYCDAAWTPDFCLWDYPTGQLLADNIGSAITLWEGRGARLVDVVKGQPFIAGCINKDGEEEVGRIRYSIKQKTNISNDKFGENDFITLGKYPHTALAVYREQLWAFSRYQVHRIQFHDIYDEFKYEVLEAIEGQGTFNIKTVCVGQEGVYWCNENGVWFSDGRTPVCISQSVESTYMTIIDKNRVRMGRKYFLPRSSDFVNGINTSMELNYDTTRDEMVLSCMVDIPESVRSRFKIASREKELKLVYNVKNKNWRVESLRTIPGLLHTVSAVNKLKTPLDTMYELRLLVDKALGVTRHVLSFGIKNNKEVVDSIVKSRTDTKIDSIDDLCDYLVDFGEIGNGYNDYILGSAKVEVEPYRFNEYSPNPAPDPENFMLPDAKDYSDPAFLIDTRAGVSDDDRSSVDYIDLVQKNFANSGKSIYVSSGSTPEIMNKESTAVNLLSPVLSYRRLRFWLKGKNAKVIRSVMLFYNELHRKFFT